MKFTLNFKTPDVMDYALEEIKDSKTPYDDKEIRQLMKKYVKWGEYITVEIDTESKEARVVPV